MIEAATRYLLLPLHERLRGRETIAHYRRLRRTEQLSAEALEARREAKLQALVDHCLEQVPFYRERLREAGVRAGADVTLANLNRLPALERSDIQEDPDYLCAENYAGHLIRYSTGGSTGHPLVFYTDRRKEARHNAHKLRYRAWFGVHPGDRQVDFWGSPIEWDRQTRLRWAKDRWLLNQRLLSAFELTPERLDVYIRELRAFQPRLIYGYPTVIYRVAARMHERGSWPRVWRPRLVACTAEMLLEQQRRTIERAFGCSVANEYGSRDAGLIAHECPAGSMHLAAEHVVAEVDEPREDGVGDLLVTNLDGYGMPLLRYRVGDRAALADGVCECGRPLPRMAPPTGRSNDFLVGGHGKAVHSLAPIYVLREISKVAQFRVRQRTDHSLEVQLVVREALSGSDLEDIRARLKRVLDEDVAIDFRFPEVIAPERSGKYRWVVSDVWEAS
ncbi:MAG TPA: phenylacetate--CoA ligase family protein [Gammaproteobacteria bacterium]|nr:phenylacetate--CoA ligase family protein [Gammaproteobacteria bacterium]